LYSFFMFFHIFRALILSSSKHSSLIFSFHHLTGFFYPLCFCLTLSYLSAHMWWKAVLDIHTSLFPILYTVLSFTPYTLHLILHLIPLVNITHLQKLILTYLKYILCKQHNDIYDLSHDVKGFHYHTI
jgi:hypothetical protein